jgi:hypothetical protein
VNDIVIRQISELGELKFSSKLACGKIRRYALNMLRSPFRATKDSLVLNAVTEDAKAAAISGGSAMICMAASLLYRFDTTASI